MNLFQNDKQERGVLDSKKQLATKISNTSFIAFVYSLWDSFFYF